MNPEGEEDYSEIVLLEAPRPVSGWLVILWTALAVVAILGVSWLESGDLEMGDITVEVGG